MSEEIDIEILITLVESRPVLWDKSLEIYKNKILTKNAWKDLCEALDPTFKKDMNDEGKNKFGKEVMKRWSNIRDSYTKSKKKIKDATKSGAGASHLKKYIYNDQLKFLDKVTEERSTEDSLLHEKDSSGDQNEESCTSFKKPRYGNRSKTTRNKIDPVEEKLLQALDNPQEENRHISFFKGIIPSLSSFDEDDIIQLQIGVLQLISSIKKQKSSRTTIVPMTPGIRNYTLQQYTSQSPTGRQYYASQGQPGTSQQFTQSPSQLETVTGSQFHTLEGQPGTSRQFPQSELQATSASQYDYSSYGQQCFSPEGMLSESSSVSSIDFGNDS